MFGRVFLIISLSTAFAGASTAAAATSVVDGCDQVLDAPPIEFSFSCTASGLNAADLSFGDWGATSTTSSATFSTRAIDADGNLQDVLLFGQLTFLDRRDCGSHAYYATALTVYTVPPGSIVGDPGERSGSVSLSVPAGCGDGSNDIATTEDPASCGRKTVYRRKGLRYVATGILRTPQISCTRARDLLRATYGQGPYRKKIYKRVYSGGSGRPTLYIKGGWRCSNGAGGAACWSTKPSRNVIYVDGLDHGLAITANVDVA